MVIVILGILAATALPKFVDLSKDARGAVLDSIAGSVKSASTMIYGKALIAGQTGATGTITANGATVSLAYGYPDTNATTGIDSLLADKGGATVSGGNTWRLNGSTTCQVTYAAATSSVPQPEVTVTKDGC
jgi:MSHA pilin protein MshA